VSNQIDFTILCDDEQSPVLTPIIDGVSLVEQITCFEQQQAFDPPGGYRGLVLTHFNFGSLDDYLSDRPSETCFRDANGRAWVLGCQCGEVGCWPLAAMISRERDKVVWSRFAQPHRGDRIYSDFGPFLFDSNTYISAVANAAKQARRACVV
jgi:hypothetical protein